MQETLTKIKVSSLDLINAIGSILTTEQRIEIGYLNIPLEDGRTIQLDLVTGDILLWDEENDDEIYLDTVFFGE